MNLTISDNEANVLHPSGNTSGIKVSINGDLLFLCVSALVSLHQKSSNTPITTPGSSSSSSSSSSLLHLLINQSSRGYLTTPKNDLQAFGEQTTLSEHSDLFKSSVITCKELLQSSLTVYRSSSTLTKDTTTSTATSSSTTTSRAIRRFKMDNSCNKKIAYDFSAILYPSEIEQMDMWEVVFKCVIVGILLIVAVISNTLVIVIVFVSRKMRTTTNFYIVNLAIADLLVACFPMWIYVTIDVTDGFILGEFFCKFNAFVQTSSMSAISFTMMAIAGDRFFAIVFPLKARVTQRKVKVVVFFIWLFAFSIGIPPLVFYTYTERQWKDYKETFCTDIWPMVETSGGCDQGATSERIYWTITVAALNWIPMLVMSINYTVIIHRLRFARVAAHRGKDALSLVQRRSATKVIKMLFSLLIAFMVCTIPFQVSTLYENYKDKQTKLPSWYQPVYFSAINLMYTHSAINPIIYGAMNQSFRAGFRHLIDRIRGRKSSPWDYVSGGLDSTIRPNAHVTNRDGSGKNSRDSSYAKQENTKTPGNYDSKGVHSNNITHNNKVATIKDGGEIEEEDIAEGNVNISLDYHEACVNPTLHCQVHVVDSGHVSDAERSVETSIKELVQHTTYLNKAITMD